MSFACPTCGAKAAVILTRTRDGAVRRRHQCSADPTHRFTTVQTVVKDYERTLAPDEFKPLKEKPV